MADVELKPCPFCGGKAAYFTDADEDGDMSYGIKCIKYPCEASIEGFTDLEYAAEAWNRRVYE